jgi:5-methyltetrahydropteroyltriglutamate--homocysteine methyltransferase
LRVLAGDLRRPIFWLVARPEFRSVKDLKGRVLGIATDEAAFLKQHAPGPFKVCVPSVVQFADSKYKAGVTDKVYSTRRAMIQDFAAIIGEEVQRLIDAGTAYVQLDGPSYLTHLLDSRRREQLRETGADPDAVLDDVIAVITP